MVKFINIADLKDPNDSQSRTYREVNNGTPHKYDIGDLIEITTGVRLFVAQHKRDCDGTPLYTLTPEMRDENDSLKEMCFVYGYSEDDMNESFKVRMFNTPNNNPSCFGKKLDVEACNNGCPVSDECYKQ